MLQYENVLQTFRFRFSSEKFNESSTFSIPFDVDFSQTNVLYFYLRIRLHSIDAFPSLIVYKTIFLHFAQSNLRNEINYIERKTVIVWNRYLHKAEMGIERK